jgi:hypothetical protein
VRAGQPIVATADQLPEPDGRVPPDLRQPAPRVGRGAEQRAGGPQPTILKCASAVAPKIARRSASDLLASSAIGSSRPNR